MDSIVSHIKYLQIFCQSSPALFSVLSVGTEQTALAEAQVRLKCPGRGRPGHTSTISTQILRAKPKAMHRQAGYRFVWWGMV